MLTREMDSFPYPFKGEQYRYSNNSVPMTRPSSIEITPRYTEEIQLKRNLLNNYPERCFQTMPHTLKGQWEAVDLVTEHLAAFFPSQFALQKNGDHWTFENKLLGEAFTFTYGDETTIPYQPLDFIGRHVQEDLIFMLERDGDLHLDAGQLCFPANWSLAFNLGMRFKEIHHPIPGFKEEELDERILRFLMRMEAGSPWERLNWSLMAGNKLDTSLETFHEWGKERKNVTEVNAGDLVHLRVEVQKLFRLPQSNGILFTIHTHLLAIKDLAANRDWLQQFYHILKELPEHIAEYKGIALYQKPLLSYLKGKLT
ncbi:heme-dependent oxidative N-demethylase family protein [Fictibacillus terranigra]|uniref:DUF3445 domain-containing protein n=1 Tax=Fictibacillus terranigra TaxID=3058424 RepID=A0ABT8EAV6_9BACL|nr:DUF3445 domain-containing protein [Fictibacillus sp. CENA-BCM004]MDN4075061.1 DUF3445 domain-containing protein [Fictibacillus sp. CENA-BCM004]